VFLLLLLHMLFPRIVGSQKIEYECYDFSHFEEVEVEVLDTPEPVYKATGVSDVDALLSQYDWDIRIARAVMLCESNGNPNALNNNPATNDYSVGLFQINLYGNLRADRPSEEWLKVPANNIEYAYTLYSQSGWKPWVNCGRKTGAF
jgi:hypothetical protein